MFSRKSYLSGIDITKNQKGHMIILNFTWIENLTLSLFNCIVQFIRDLLIHILYIKYFKHTYIICNVIYMHRYNNNKDKDYS